MQHRQIHSNRQYQELFFFFTLNQSLLKNPVLMCLVLASAVEALVATGFATFLPKFIENQFGFSSSYAATLGGNVFIYFIFVLKVLLLDVCIK